MPPEDLNDDEVWVEKVGDDLIVTESFRGVIRKGVSVIGLPGSKEELTGLTKGQLEELAPGKVPKKSEPVVDNSGYVHKPLKDGEDPFDKNRKNT